MIRISVVTATYNSAATVEQTVRSVLAQTYPAYEYIVMDGGSTDGTVDLVKSFEDELAAAGTTLIVVSEPDEGMYDAMNKGVTRASGDVVGIINSDDWYEDCALDVVAREYDREPFDLFWADLRLVMPNGKTFVKRAKNRSYATSRDWNHPTTFIAKSIYEKYLYRTDSIHDDYDLILRLKKDNVKMTVVNKVIANFRMEGVSHKRSVSAAFSSVKMKYMIYRRNGYGRRYLIECLMEEVGKLIIG